MVQAYKTPQDSSADPCKLLAIMIILYFSYSYPSLLQYPR